MPTKLTLSADDSVIEIAKRSAAARNTSVSAMLARFVTGLEAMNQPNASPALAPLTLAATGLISEAALSHAGVSHQGLADAAGDEKLLEDALADRYGTAE